MRTVVFGQVVQDVYFSQNVGEDAGHVGYVVLCCLASSCRLFKGFECLPLASQAVKEECLSQDCLSPKMKAL